MWRCLLARAAVAALIVLILRAFLGPAGAQPIDERFWNLRVPEAFSTARATTSDCSAYRAQIDAAARAAGVVEPLGRAVVRKESGCNPRATGKRGEVGLMQIKVSTARGLGFAGTRAQLYEPATNLAFGMRYLARALARGGPGCAGVSLYQRGIYAAPLCTGYGRTVLALAGIAR